MDSLALLPLNDSQVPDGLLTIPCLKLICGI
jgi:hypothetical protein